VYFLRHPLPHPSPHPLPPLILSAVRLDDVAQNVNCSQKKEISKNKKKELSGVVTVLKCFSVVRPVWRSSYADLPSQACGFAGS
jgi:hypothetical protein